MFGHSSGPSKEEDASATGSNGSPTGRNSTDETSPGNDKKRRSSSVAKAKDMLTSARQSLHLGVSPNSSPSEKSSPNPFSKLGKNDPALSVPQGSLNNSAGESLPTPKSTFRVGVTEDKNKKCRRTMEDTHAYLYNFLSTPAPALGSEAESKSRSSVSESATSVGSEPSQQVIESDNGYFAIFDGHAGTFAADWCGKKLHILLEDTIRKNPNTPVPELLDQTFTAVDQQLEKLPLKNSGCTAVVAVLRWEDRVPSSQSATGSTFFAPAAAAAVKAASESTSSQNLTIEDATPTQQSTDSALAGSGTPEQKSETASGSETKPESKAESRPESKLRETASRQRVLYTANVGDARIVLCRKGRALRLSYDHKGGDENEGRRVANAGGLILNNRVNGVLAVTRALGDAYMKDLVTGHPYTTETVIQPDQDEFLILACDGLWDVCSDQEAVDLVRQTTDPQAASKQLVDHALARFSTDNLSCMIVRFDNKALKQRRTESSVGVDGDSASGAKGSISEADALVEQARKSMSESGGVPVGEHSGETLESVVEEMKGSQEDQEEGPEVDDEAKKEEVEKKQGSGG